MDGNLALVGSPFFVAKFQQKLCKQIVMKNAGVEMIMDINECVDMTPFKPTAIRRQPEAVSFVRKTARPGGCAPVSPRETLQEGWKKAASAAAARRVFSEPVDR